MPSISVSASTSTAYERVRDALESSVTMVKDTGDKITAQCPAHHDSNPSLSVGHRRDRKGVVVHCHAGCAPTAVMDALDLTVADLFDEPKQREIYGLHRSYRYPGGRQVHRKPNKEFPQSGNLDDRSLFGSDKITADTKTVYVVEGEKDVEAVDAAGGVAVCSPMGAGKADRADWSELAGKNVIIIADKDKAGRAHAADVIARIVPCTASVHVAEAKVGKDFADHYAAGYSLDDLVLVAPDKPIPLIQKITIPAFPVDSLPSVIADMVHAVSEATQTDPAMAGTSALSTLAACAGGRVTVEIRPGWREPLNVYTATIAAPGERKSAVQSEMTRPLLHVERDLADRGEPARLEAETRQLVAAKAAERQRNTAANADTDADAALADAIGAAMLAASIEVPPIPRLLADDITPEAAASLLAEQQGRLAIISAEGGVFDIIAGRYSKLPNLDLWLKGHAGDPMKVDRKGRPPEYIPRPALTLGLMIQHQVLDAIAANREFRGRGLLARFLYAYPESKVGRRTIAATPVGDEVRRRYEEAVTDLASGLADQSGEPGVLVLSDTAQEAMQTVETAVEPTLAGDGQLASLADWGAKYCGAVARIAGILHLAQHGHERGLREPISAQTVLAAARIGNYFQACAIQAFAEMGTDPVTADAVYLLDRIQRLGLDVVSERDMLRAAKRFRSKAELTAALNRLVDNGWLIPQPDAGPTGGRPASPTYLVEDGR